MITNGPKVFGFLERAMSDRAGECPSYQLNMQRRIARERVQGARPYQSQQHRLIKSANLVYRLAYNGDVAAGQLAVFQGASEAPISGSIRAERATRKNSQPAAARRVALKMGRRPRGNVSAYRRIGVSAFAKHHQLCRDL